MLWAVCNVLSVLRCVPCAGLGSGGREAHSIERAPADRWILWAGFSGLECQGPTKWAGWLAGLAGRGEAGWLGLQELPNSVILSAGCSGLKCQGPTEWAGLAGLAGCDSGRTP